ncbi:MAG: GerMN domain-containing protein [Bacillota bacterium]
MKRFEPYYYIVIIAGIFVFGGLVLFSLQLLPSEDRAAVAVDPQASEEGEDLYDFWFSSVEIYDISVDHNMDSIIFSADNNTVSLLDRERKLKWDKTFDTVPNQAKISSGGNFAAVGTEGGLLYYTSIDQVFEWTDEGYPVKLVSVSPNASWIAAARDVPDQDQYQLDFYNHEGDLKWSLETKPIKNLYLTSEYLEQANIYFTTEEDGQTAVHAVNFEGKELWSYEDETLAAVSKHGSRLAAYQGETVTVYDSLGYPMWSTSLPFEPVRIVFNPQNYNRLLIYGGQEGSGENLFYYDLADGLLWMSRIADGSLFSFTADGQYIVTSSWRQYKEDYTKMTLLNRDGIELNSWEVAMRVEHLLMSGHPHLAAVCGENGYIDMVNLEPLFIEENNNDQREVKYYNPVAVGKRADESKIVLYFIDENNNLIPVTRTVNETEDMINTALQELIRGPARDSDLYRTVPDKGITVEAELNQENNTLNIDFSTDLKDINGVNQAEAFYDSLIMTVSQFLEEENILLTSGGEVIEYIGDEFKLEQPLQPVKLEKPIYEPVTTGSRYYLVVNEGAGEDDAESDLSDLIERTLHACRSLPFFPTNVDLKGLNQSSDQVQINLNNAMKSIFPEDPTEKEYSQAMLVLDALFTTVFKNSSTQRIEILIDGEPWTTPVGYPSISRFYRQPAFVNPE